MGRHRNWWNVVIRLLVEGLVNGCRLELSRWCLDLSWWGLATSKSLSRYALRRRYWLCIACCTREPGVGQSKNERELRGCAHFLAKRSSSNLSSSSLSSWVCLGEICDVSISPLACCGATERGGTSASGETSWRIRRRKGWAQTSTPDKWFNLSLLRLSSSALLCASASSASLCLRFHSGSPVTGFATGVAAGACACWGLNKGCFFEKTLALALLLARPISFKNLSSLELLGVHRSTVYLKLFESLFVSHGGFNKKSCTDHFTKRTHSRWAQN